MPGEQRGVLCARHKEVSSADLQGLPFEVVKRGLSKALSAAARTACLHMFDSLFPYGIACMYIFDSLFPCGAAGDGGRGQPALRCGGLLQAPQLQPHGPVNGAPALCGWCREPSCRHSTLNCAKCLCASPCQHLWRTGFIGRSLAYTSLIAERRLLLKAVERAMAGFALRSHREGTNQPWGAQALFCSAHKEPDMINVNIRDRQCAMPECAKYPSCNFPGSTDGLYCGAWFRSLVGRRWPCKLCLDITSALLYRHSGAASARARALGPC